MKSKKSHPARRTRFVRLAAALVLAAVLTAAFAACGAGAASSGSAAPASSAASGSMAASSAPASSAPAASGAAAGTGVLASFTAQDLDGNTVDGTLWQGHKLTLVNVWGTFCGPCLSEMPDLGTLSAEYADKGVQFVGVVIDALNSDGSYSDDVIATAKQLVEQTGANYLHVLPSQDLINAKLSEVQAVPTMFFVDENGAIVGETYLGARSADDWRTIIDGMLAQM